MDSKNSETEKSQSSSVGRSRSIDIDQHVQICKERGVKFFSQSRLTERPSRSPAHLEEICANIVKDFLEVAALFRLENVQIATGYDFMKHIQHRYHLSIGAGRAYSTLYSLERQGYVKGEQRSTKRLYSITPTGEALIRTVTRNLHFLMALVASLLSY